MVSESSPSDLPHPVLEDLESVFSILPEEQASEARHKAFQHYIGQEDLLEHSVKWADFDNKGCFVIGGATDLVGFSTKLIIADQNDDDDIKTLMDIANDGNATPGYLEYSPSRNAIIWFLPLLIENKNQQPTNGLRALLISEPLVHEILDIFCSNKITLAEKHLVFQLVGGLSLREAAKVDHLSFETKRAQLKTTCSKMQCGGQTDLLRQVLGQMTYLFSICDSRKNSSGKLEAFAREFLSADTRMAVQRLSNGRTLRILERGPIDGKPVLLMHGMLWPMIFNGSSDPLYAAGIRLLVPLRAGYIDEAANEEISASGDLVADSLEDIARYQKETIGGSIAVVGYSNGGSIALRYARLFPELVSQLFIISINSAHHNAINSGFVGTFFNGLKSLANRPGLFRYLTWQFKKYYTDERTVKRILRKMFGSSESDLNLIDGKADTLQIYTWFVALYQRSIPGIADEFRYVMGNWPEELAQLQTEICFIHGSQDPLVGVQTIQLFVEKKEGVALEIISEAGHHLISTHANEIWKIVKNRTL